MTQEQKKTKEYLSQAFYIDQRINSKIEMVSSLHDLAATLSDTVVSRTRNNHKMENVIVKIIDLENEINSDIDELVDLKQKLISEIKNIKRIEYQTILEKRYLCFQSWEQIAVDMDYDLRWVYRMHIKAIDEFTKTRHVETVCLLTKQNL